MNDTEKDIFRKQSEIIRETPINKRLNNLFEMTELSRKIFQNRIITSNPGISEIELKIELFKAFYRFDFDSKTISLITNDMRLPSKKASI